MVTASKSNKNSYYPFYIQAILAVVIGLLLFGILSSILLIRFESNQRGRILSGVNMAGVDLSGLTVQEAALLLKQQITYQSAGSILIIDKEKSWLATPNQLGFGFDAEASAKAAYQYGRDQSLIQNFLKQLNSKNIQTTLPPVAYYNQTLAYQYLQNLANQIDTPVFEAKIEMKGVAVEVKSGQIGRELDIEASLKQLDQILMTMQDGVVFLKVEETEPLIMDASAAAKQAEIILKEPLVIKLPEDIDQGGPWTITREELANLLVIERIEDDESADYHVGLDKDALIIYLTTLAPNLKREAVNARYIFNDDTRLLEVIEPAVIGHTLNVESSLTEIVAKVMEGEHEVTLQMDINNPDAKDDTTGEALGITELVHSETSYFYGSDSARVQNIRAASSAYHGLLIPPGATFSMGSQLTDISLENGFAEALIIVGGQTIKGVGGGVCQVSTTLFRAAFFAGFPIVERHAHAYRVGYYEQRSDGSRNPNLAGLDATVYFPLVDMKFTNNTPYWLLMETYMGNYSLTWKFYSTKDGRSVEWNTTGITNVIPAPDDLYRENPELDEGEIRQIDYAADGASINVTRAVIKDSAVYFEDNFYTQYRPWQAIFEYGPGTEGIPTPTPEP